MCILSRSFAFTLIGIVLIAYGFFFAYVGYCTAPMVSLHGAALARYHHDIMQMRTLATCVTPCGMIALLFASIARHDAREI